MKNRFLPVSALVLFLTGGTLGIVFAEKVNIAIVVDSRGSAVLNSGNLPPQNLPVGSEIGEGDSISAGAQSFVKFIRADSSIFKLNENTRLDIEPSGKTDEKGSVLRLISGKLFIGIFREKSVSKKLLVKTPSAFCIIRDAQIYITVSAAGVPEFTLLSGTADIFNDYGTVQMKEGSRTTVPSNRPPEQPVSFDIAGIERWDLEIEKTAPPSAKEKNPQPRAGQNGGQGTKKAPSLEVKPYLFFGVISDGNIYSQKTDAVKAMITEIMPGIDISLPISSQKFNLKYRAEILNYSVDSTTQNTKNHILDASAELKFPAGIFLNLAGGYKNTRTPELIELTERTKREQSDISAEAGLSPEGRKFNASAVYLREQQKYARDTYRKILNRTVSVPGLNIYYNFSLKASLLAGGNIGAIEYVNSPAVNSKYSEFFAGVTGRLLSRTSGYIKAGAQIRKYDELTDSAGRPRKFTQAIAFAGTKTDLNEKTGLELNASMLPVESVYYGSVYDNVYSILKSAEMKLNRKLGEKSSAYAAASFGINSYPEKTFLAGNLKKRQDTIGSAGAGFTLPFADGVEFSAGYEFKIRDSNFSSFNYSDSLINAGCRVTF